MKTMLLMRHAKSSWDNDKLSDYDRLLNDRGRQDAPRMGKLLRQFDVVPDKIISSSARRAAATAELIAQAASYEGEIDCTRQLYLAEPEDYLEIARRTDDGVNVLMLVGHNPGIEELLGELCGREERMPTGALARLRLPISHWAELAAGKEYELVGVWRPKEL